MTLQDDYRAVREGAALGSISERALLAVAGPDRATFLQGLLTNDILALQPGSGCYAAWLTPQGRMLTDMHVLESGDSILLDVPRHEAAGTLERLEQFHFSEDVELASRADGLAAVWLHGPQGAATLERVLRADGLAGWPEYRHARFDFEGAPVTAVRIDQAGVPGYGVYIEAGREAELTAALEGAGAVRIGRAALEAARIEAGYPVFGVDMTHDTIPLEAGIEQRAISFTKGCYVGQEIIIRVLHRGGGRVAKKLVALRVNGDPDPADLAGTRLYAGDRDIGHVTSAAVSPVSGTVALAYVHRDYAAPGTAIEAACEGGRLPAAVTDRPMRPAA